MNTARLESAAVDFLHTKRIRISNFSIDVTRDNFKLNYHEATWNGIENLRCTLQPNDESFLRGHEN